MRAHAGNAAAGLVALGAFEDEVGLRLARGRLSESEYQTVAHRLARAASRLAMRRDLGLDDGVPGAPPPDVGVSR